MGFSRNRNWCLLQNRPLQYGISSICLTKLLMRFFTFDIEWDFPGTEIGVFFKIVLFNIVFFNVAHKSLKVVSSSKVSWYPFKSSIGSIFSDWIFLYFLPKVAWDFRMRFLFLSFRFVSRAAPWSVSGLIVISTTMCFHLNKSIQYISGPSR